MRDRGRTALAASVFFAFTAPLGIAAHLIAEFFGLGWHDDADVFFSARHLYLAILAAVALGALFAVLRGVPASRRRRRIAEIVASLPFEGRGAGFTLVSFLAQFAFFAVTQIGEGCPLCGGDVVVGIFAAAVAAAFGAVAVSLGKRRVLEFVFALALALAIAADTEVGAFRAAARRREATRLARRRTPFAFRYRPPPVLTA